MNLRSPGYEDMNGKNLGIARPARWFLSSLRACFPLCFPLRTEICLYERLHAGGAVLAHALGEVAVPVQGKGRAGVAQVVLDGLDIVPGADRADGIRVPEVVEARSGQTGGLGGLPELLPDAGLVERAAGVVGKNQAVGVVPQRPGQELPLRLPPPSGRRPGGPSPPRPPAGPSGAPAAPPGPPADRGPPWRGPPPSRPGRSARCRPG